MAILAGCGRIRTYAPFALAGAILNPLLIALGVWKLPEEWQCLAPACSFCLTCLVVHLLVLPLVTSRQLGVAVFELFRPCLAPLAAALLANTVFLVLPHSASVHVILAMMVYGLVYAVLLALMAAATTRFRFAQLGGAISNRTKTERRRWKIRSLIASGLPAARDSRGD
jgi:hypothetical protein